MDEVTIILISAMKASLVIGAALFVFMIFETFRQNQMVESKDAIDHFGKLKKAINIIKVNSDEIVIYSLAVLMGICAGFLFGRYSKYLADIIIITLTIAIPLGVGILIGFIIERLRRRQAGYETVRR
jgi:hypothetical protein